MPILVKDFSWDQNNDTVIITVPLKGIMAKNVSIFSTESYVKISYPPFLFECFLHDKTINEESSVQIGNGQAVFKLKKDKTGLWEALEITCTEQERQVLRNIAIDKYRMQEENKEKKMAELKQDLKNFGVKKQIELEQEHRRWIEGEKKKERDQAEDELEEWKHEKKTNETQPLSQDSTLKEECFQNKKSSKPPITKVESIEKQIFEDSSPIRSSTRLSINFTPRVFPTPSRESMADEENEWLTKQAEARKIMEIEDMNLSEEEKNPIWLRDKGNRFFEEGNYLSAINAYTHAIRMNSTMASLYSNRAACHLKMRNCFKCLEDCTKALELLTPPIEQNKLSRIKAHIRRGTAFVTLKMYAEGLLDYEAAKKLDPNNEEIKKDAEKIRRIVEGRNEEE